MIDSFCVERVKISVQFWNNTVFSICLQAQDDETSVDLTGRVFVRTPGCPCFYVLIARDHQQWRTSLGLENGTRFRTPASKTQLMRTPKFSCIRLAYTSKFIATVSMAILSCELHSDAHFESSATRNEDDRCIRA